MLYARFASGCRPGGPNPSCVLAGNPCEFNPDEVRNYEVGLKGDFIDHALTLDASLYYIDWRGIQVALSGSPPLRIAYTTNGGQAKSEGIELSTTLRPLDGLTIVAWGSYDNAVLTEDFPASSPVSGLSGDRLPFSSRYTGSLNVEQEFSLPASLTGYVGGEMTYVGDRMSVFTTAGNRLPLPGYTQYDLRAGVKADRWTANLYVTNLTDERGLLNRGLGNNLIPYSRIYTQPRTVGVNVTTLF
jgi:outer membrane receptor protein involved in Fe transport